MEAQVRANIAALGPLSGFKPTRAAVAIALARLLDHEKVTASWLIALRLEEVLQSLDVTEKGGETKVDELARKREEHLSRTRRMA